MSDKEQIEAFIEISNTCAYQPGANLFPEVVEQAISLFGKEELAGHLEVPVTTLESWAEGSDLPEETLAMNAMAMNWNQQAKKLLK